VTPVSTFYDIEKPCRFEAVAALIAYYSRVSLKEYNHNLDLVLTYGVSKFKFGKTTEWSTDKLYGSFRDASDHYDKLLKKSDGLEADIYSVREDLSQKKLACEAFDKIVQMYDAQIQQISKVINQNLLRKTNAISSTRLLASQMMPTRSFTESPNKQTASDISEDEVAQVDAMMKENSAKLQARIVELQKRKEELAADIEYLNTIVHQLQEELDLLRPELVEMNKKRENYHMWLVQRGENDEKIQAKMKTQSKIDFGNFYEPAKQVLASTKSLDSNFDSLDLYGGYSAHENSLNWFRADFSRDDAIAALSGRADGTYLLRPNSKPISNYVLSIVYQGQVKHILIEEDNTGCYIKTLGGAGQQKQVDESQSKSQFLSVDSKDRTLSRSSSSLSSLSSTGSTLQIGELDSAANNPLKFKTLTELVAHYSTNRIKDSNIDLDIILVCPAFSEK
jgi:hypothetical protein